MATNFKRLNEGWNAEPNAPDPTVEAKGSTIVLQFAPNPFQFPEYQSVRAIELTFKGCSCYRLGPTNDEGWYRGQCRFSRLAPDWGEFYSVEGDLKLEQVGDWVALDTPGQGQTHFLFYFRDNTFECQAQGWSKRDVA